MHIHSHTQTDYFNPWSTFGLITKEQVNKGYDIDGHSVHGLIHIPQDQYLCLDQLLQY